MIRNQSHIALEGPDLSVKCVALASDRSADESGLLCIGVGR